MRLLLILPGLLIWSISLSANPDTSFLHKQYQQANQWSEQKQFTLAQGLAQKTLSQLEEVAPDAHQLKSQLLNILGDCAVEAGNYPLAYQQFSKASSLLTDNRLEESLAMAEVDNKLGNYYQEIKEYEKALLHLESGLEIRRRLLDPIHLKVADSYNNIGNCKNELGDYDKALEYHDQALSIRLGQLGEPHPLVAQSYHNIGVCLQNKAEYVLAMDAYQNAERNYREVYGSEHFELADVYLNLGTIFGEQEQPEQYIAYQQRALDIYQKRLSAEHPNVALCLSNLASAYTSLGDFSRVDELNQQALSIRKKLFGAVHPDVADTYFNIGASYFMRGEERRALTFFDTCLFSLNLQNTKQLDRVNKFPTLLQLYPTVGMTNWNYAVRTDSISYLDSALLQFERADHLIDFLRGRYESAGSKLELADQAHFIYDLAIEVCFELYKATQDQIYLEKAFSFSEKSKGILLLEALKNEQTASFAGVPESTLQEIKAKEISIAELEKRRFLEWERVERDNEQEIDSLNTLIFEERSQLSELLNQVADKYPQYYNALYNTRTITIESIQKNLLDKDQSLVAYFVGENDIYVFIVNREEFFAYQVPLTNSLPLLIDNFHQAVQQFTLVSTQDLNKNLDQYAQSAYQLYQLLIEPVTERLKKELIIIPDGSIGLVPFAALLTAPPAALNKLKSYPYLIRDYAICYNYSAMLLQEMKAHKTSSSLNNYLGFAPSFRENNPQKLAPLKHNTMEISSVNAFFGGSTFTATEASKKQFLDIQDQYRILHLATHGKANSTSADFSYLAFSIEDDSLAQEALLFVREIYNMRTNADMIVLSACETGLGEIQTGEGIASIARSFSYAGAKSLVATQWSVDDQSTKKLIEAFMKNIKKGLPKHQALQAAQLSFLSEASSSEAHPYYWAALIAIGDMDKIHFSKPYLFYAAGLIFLLLGLVFYFRRRNRKIS